MCSSVIGGKVYVLTVLVECFSYFLSGGFLRLWGGLRWGVDFGVFLVFWSLILCFFSLLGCGKSPNLC